MGSLRIVGADHPLWQLSSLILEPTGAGRSYAVQIKDGEGNPAAGADAAGAVRAQGGEVILQAPLTSGRRKDRPIEVGLRITDAEGAELGSGRVVKWGVGPRARKATVEIVDVQGGEVARIEPRDGKGEQLAIVAGEAELATIAVEQVKRGFLRKARVYTVQLSAEIPDDVRRLVLTAAIRYDALLSAVVAAASRDV